MVQVRQAVAPDGEVVAVGGPAAGGAAGARLVGLLHLASGWCRCRVVVAAGKGEGRNGE